MHKFSRICIAFDKLYNIDFYWLKIHIIVDQYRIVFVLLNQIIH